MEPEIRRRSSARLMEGVTDETREQPEKGRDEAGPALSNDTLPIGKDDPSVPAVTDPGEEETEPPPDWLEPLEDCEDEGNEGVEVELSSRRRKERRINTVRKPGRPSVSANCAWVDCPELGSGWKRKVIFWRAGNSATYYLSPKGVRFRSKVQLAKHLKADLTLFDYKEGKFVDTISPRKRRKARAKEGARRSRPSSSRRSTPDPDKACTSENLTTPLQNGPLSPQRPHLTPIPLSTSPPLKCSYRSPPELTPVSPTILQQPSPSPSLILDDLTVQTNPVSQTWLQSSLAPVSPTKTPESDFPTFPNDQSALKDSSYLQPIPLAQLAQDPGGGIGDHGLPPLEGCANCGRKYPGMGSGKHLLCRKCRPARRNQQPHIIFKKVGQDRWILGSSKNDIKKKISPLGRRRPSVSKSLKFMAEQEKVKKELQPDSDEDDDGPDGGPDDDDDDYGPKKRQRRMCGQCKACLRKENCGKCDFCLDKTRYGGPNKLRQKCRFRQCQLRSRLQTGSLKYARAVGLVDSGQGEPSSQKHGRSWGRKKRKRRSTSSKYCTDNDNDSDGNYVGRRSSRKGQRGGRPKRYGYRRRRVKDEEEEDKVTDAETEDGGPGHMEQDPFVVADDGSSGFYESEELYSNNYIQNGPSLDILRGGGRQPVEVEYPEIPRIPGLVYAIPGLPDGSQLLTSVLPNGVPLQLSAVPGTHAAPLMLEDSLGKAAPPQHSKVLTSTGPPLQLSDFLRNHGLELVEVDSTIPQILPVPPIAHPVAPPIAPPMTHAIAPPTAHSTSSLGAPTVALPTAYSTSSLIAPPAALTIAPPIASPTAHSTSSLIAPPTALTIAPPIVSPTAHSTSSLIAPPTALTIAPPTAPSSHEAERQGEAGTSPEIHSLADSTHSSSIRDSGLLELLTSLRRTILPAHWVGVMANGPILQLFQCSKLSPMADTVLQIEPDFFYEISVQNQPLLPTHGVYERHPARLTSVSKVVTLLLDLEELNVCQGYQSFEANSRREPLLCARAALCQLLVPQDEDSCEKCQECNPLGTS